MIKKKSDQKHAKALISKGKYLDAAEVIFSEVDAPEYRNFFRERLLTPRYKPSRIHEYVLQMDPKIVVTTNYDRVYDEYCTKGGARDGYSVKNYYDEHVLDEIRSTARVVLKAHGCITDTSRIVLSRSQYFSARAKQAGFFSLLDSLFLCNTLFFVGYGLADPDIQLVLENANIAMPSEHPHYALVPQGQHPAIAESMRRAYNVRLIEYKNPDGTHSAAVDALKDLSDSVRGYRATFTSVI